MTNYESMEAALRSINPVLKTIGEMYNSPTQAIEKISKVAQQLSGISDASDILKSSKAISKQMERIQRVDFSKIKGVQEQIKGMQAIANYIGMETSLYSSVFPNITKALESYQTAIGFDYNGMMEALQNTLIRQNKTEEYEETQEKGDGVNASI